jgi:ketosteroid isomerase-like protein
MANRSSIEAQLRAAYSARQSGDLEGSLTIFDENAVFRAPGSSNAWPGLEAKGKEAIRTTLKALIAEFKLTSVRFGAMVIEGNHAVVQISVQMSHLPRGKSVETEWIDFWTFKNGRCVLLTEYLDTALIASLQSPS